MPGPTPPPVDPAAVLLRLAYETVKAAEREARSPRWRLRWSLTQPPPRRRRHRKGGDR
jgi:hypothetical protein